MSRIIIKNLPKKITEDKLRQIFGEKGTVTDIQLKYTPEGKFRQFAFIGYQDENSADDAIHFFHNTRLSTSKISVEHCAILGDDKKPKSWSKYAKDSTAYKKEHPIPIVEEVKTQKSKRKKNKNAELLEKYKDDPQFEEFLQLHAPNETKNLLKKVTAEAEENKSDADENSGEENDEEKHSIANEEIADSEGDKPALQQISDLEYMKSLMKTSDVLDNPVKTRKKPEKQVKPKIELFTVKLRGLPYSCKKKNIKEFFRPLVPYTIRIPQKVKGFAYVGFKNEKHFNQALLKDRSFIAGKQVTVAKYDLQGGKQQNNELDLKRNKWKTQEEALKNEEDIAESGRIFLRNLAYSTTEDDVQNLFAKYGPITEVNLPVDLTTRKLKGFGIVTFLMPEHAVKAYTELDGSILHGRMLHLLPGKTKDTPQQQEETTNYKQKKSEKQKAQAGSSHNWNALFLGHDAVAEVIASTYGITKDAVLAPHGDGSAAVRLALGETQIVATTRKYLEEEGVHLDAFDQPTSKRSKTVILVKNLPSQTQIKEIRELFEKFGILGRIILPPSGITAIVEFFEPTEARKAFTKLAYSKFKHLPLYLEWAPENSLSAESIKTKKEVKAVDKEANKIITNQSTEKEQNHTSTDDQKKTHHSDMDREEQDDEEPEPDTTLFVKNLNFATTDEGLRRHFESCGKIHYATVATKKAKDNTNPDTKLSMGYGFVRFMYKVGTDKALKTLQCTTLDGKTLELKRSERTLQNDVKTAKKLSKVSKQTGTKILVRNVPFQANKNEITELFRTFGEIKALRLPKKMSDGGSSHRGFAFVDFLTNSDAKKAFEALCQSTHLYGRRLVLEWASSEEGVEDIRKRTADHFHPTTEVKSKKSVLDVE